MNKAFFAIVALLAIFSICTGCKDRTPTPKVKVIVTFDPPAGYGANTNREYADAIAVLEGGSYKTPESRRSLVVYDLANREDTKTELSKAFRKFALLPSDQTLPETTSSTMNGYQAMQMEGQSKGARPGMAQSFAMGRATTVGGHVIYVVYIGMGSITPADREFFAQLCDKNLKISTER